MGRRLRMTAELGEWLTELGDSEPATAGEVGAALIAVLEVADPMGLAILGEPAAARPPDLRERADRAYQQRLEELRQIRRRVASAATDRRRTELLLEERRRVRADAEHINEAEHDLVAARLREEELAVLSRQLQGEVDRFRTAKDTAKAVYTAMEARLGIAETLEATGGEADADLAQLREDLRAAELKLQALLSGGTTEVIRHPAAQARTEPPAAAERPEPPPAPQAPGKPAPGLLELRADLLGSDIRILLAVEPADTVTLLAVLDGPEAVTEHGAQAVRLASDLLAEIREDGWPSDIDEVALADADAFLARFIPAGDGRITRRAGALAEARLLSKLRDDQHLTISELAERSGLDADRVEAIERDGLRTANVSEAVALARALGARLELPGGSGPVLAG